MDIDSITFARELEKIITQKIKDVIAASNLSDTMYATYTGEGLKVDDKPIETDMDFVEVPEHLKKYKLKISFDLTQEQLDNQVLIVKKSGERVELSRLKFDKIPIEVEYDEMKAGQRYLVQQKAGAQKFVTLDRIPEEEQ
jgi:hypothetical protein